MGIGADMAEWAARTGYTGDYADLYDHWNASLLARAEAQQEYRETKEKEKRGKQYYR